MTHPAYLSDEFNSFLHAPIGEDRNGPLSVLSALARLDLDPWREAADLARAPVEIATQKLVAIIAKLPAGTSMPHEPRTIAARLIAFLPRHPPRDTNSSDPLTIDAQANSKAVAIFVYLAIFTAAVIGAQSTLERRHPAAGAAPPEAATHRPDQ